MKKYYDKVDKIFKPSFKSWDEYNRAYKKSGLTQYLKIAKGSTVVKFDFTSLFDGQPLYGANENNETIIIRRISHAEILKQSFKNALNNILGYINYFINTEDSDDMELMIGYMFLMHNITDVSIPLDPESFILTLRSTLGTKTMRKKVLHMVNMNLGEEQLKNGSGSSLYDESIQLTDDHMRAMMGLSIFTRMAIPIASHYVSVRSNELSKYDMSAKELYYGALSSFVDVFDDLLDIKLFNKLSITGTSRISKTEGKDALMWRRRYRSGITPTQYSTTLMFDYFTDIAMKCTHDRSAIIFVNVCCDKSIHNELIQQERWEYTDMPMKSSDSVNEETSKWSKWMVDTPGPSERNTLRHKAIIDDIIKRCAKELGIDWESPEMIKELNYYRDNISKLHDNQLDLIFLYFSPKFSSYDVCNEVTRSQLNKLIVIMKRELQPLNYIYLPQYISGELDVTKMKRYNKKKLEKLINAHPSHDELIEEYSQVGGVINVNKIFDLMKSIIATPLIIRDYGNAYNGKHMKVEIEAVACDEFIRFLLRL